MELAFGYASRPFQTIPPCGDGWLSFEMGTTHRIMLADGIGHGVNAYRIVQDLKQHLIWLLQRSTQPTSLPDCLIGLHHFLQKQANQSQAAVALLDLDRDQKKIKSLIAGNVSVHLATVKTCISGCNMPGMLGGRLPGTLQETTYAMVPGSLLAVCSDGIDSHEIRDYLISRCRSGQYQVLPIQSEAEALLQRFAKITDDASCALISFRESSL